MMGEVLVDTHAHLSGPPGRFREVLDRAAAVGVAGVVLVGIDFASSDAAVGLAGTDSRVRAAVGLHPHFADRWDGVGARRLRRLAELPEVVAVGECGLDFYRNLSSREAQRRAFLEQIRLACEVGKPLVVHDRDAHREVVDLLADAGAEAVGGVMHCFSGDLGHARACLELGFHLGVAGTVTYPRATSLREVVARVPGDRLLLETDSPYLSPEPYRGRPNEPARVTLVAERVASLRGTDTARVARETTSNATRLFVGRGEGWWDGRLP